MGKLLHGCKVQLQTYVNNSYQIGYKKRVFLEIFLRILAHGLPLIKNDPKGKIDRFLSPLDLTTVTINPALTS